MSFTEGLFPLLRFKCTSIIEKGVQSVSFIERSFLYSDVSINNREGTSKYVFYRKVFPLLRVSNTIEKGPQSVSFIERFSFIQSVHYSMFYIGTMGHEEQQLLGHWGSSRPRPTWMRSAPSMTMTAIPPSSTLATDSLSRLSVNDSISWEGTVGRDDASPHTYLICPGETLHS